MVAAPDRLDERRMQTPLPAPHERTADKNALKIATLIAVQERTNVDIEHIRSGAGYGGGWCCGRLILSGSSVYT